MKFRLLISNLTLRLEVVSYNSVGIRLTSNLTVDPEFSAPTHEDGAFGDINLMHI